MVPWCAMYMSKVRTLADTRIFSNTILWTHYTQITRCLFSNRCVARIRDAYLCLVSKSSFGMREACVGISSRLPSHFACPVAVSKCGTNNAALWKVIKIIYGGTSVKVHPVYVVRSNKIDGGPVGQDSVTPFQN